MSSRLSSLRSRTGTPLHTPPPKMRRWQENFTEETKDEVEGSPGVIVEEESSTFTTFSDRVIHQERDEVYEEDEEEEQVQFHKHNKPRFGKRIQTITVGGLRMLVEFLNYTWFLLPFLCLVVALVLPRYLIAAIQATPASLTTPGQGHFNTISSIQVHMDAMIKDISHFKKFQKEQEARIEEVMFLYEQTTKSVETLVDSARTQHGDIPAGVLDHVAEMIQSALKKNIRDLKSEYKAALQPLETGLRQITAHTSVLESEIKAHKAHMQDVEDLVEGSKKQVLEVVQEAVDPEATEQRIATVVASEMNLFKDKLARVVAEETARLKEGQMQSMQQLQNATARQIEHLVEKSTTAHLTNPHHGGGGASTAVAGRVDFASLASGARIVRYKSDMVGPKFLLALQNLFAMPPLTSKSFNAFPFCSIMGNTCPVVNSNPETAITANVDLGNCWSFDGVSGKLSVKFAYPVVADAIELYHIDPRIAPDFGSAPKDIQVMGLVVDAATNEIKQVDLGSFRHVHGHLIIHWN
ncbi:Aste57867_15275 [Aphanomyces stellatus]|uniref:Aste57867_15275 protein n=1 Tax=Aphanomyces stellatus TaxID=120398 RepID=A0A485L2S4_9STRA|nr:hypothetical protein As57867_015219 [Aphanomyces stellatus]VFT92084.1 Aste57867_15275 [Aphanomyces stellatus]